MFASLKDLFDAVAGSSLLSDGGVGLSEKIAETADGCAKTVETVQTVLSSCADTIPAASTACESVGGFLSQISAFFESLMQIFLK